MQSISRMLVLLSCGFSLLACTVVTDPSSSSRSTSGGESAPSTALNKHQQISAFVAANFSRLKEDMAAGQGEYLTSLATLLDVEREQQADFFAFTQQHFAILFSAEDTTADQMLASLYRQLAAQPQFSRLVALS
ncbi:MAG: DUF3015 family protein [Candidatus Competibacteraceae bacterium]|nr:DUF3015 family protein [Candidatus Competibacteraceae bacterium]